MKRDREETLLNKMPIYSKKDIVLIKNGNVNPVLQYNAVTRPNSASYRVLLTETDPLNNLKRKYYKNSNKPLGNNKMRLNEFYNKREYSTLVELTSEV